MNFINCCKSFDEVQSEWEYIFRNNHYQDNIFFNFFDLKKIWWQIFQNNNKQLFIVSNTEKSMIAPLIEENGLITFVGDKDLVDYQDFIFKEDVSFELLKDFFDYCFNNLNAKIIKFESIQETSPTLKIIKELQINSEFFIKISDEDVAPFINLPQSWEQFLFFLSKKNRHEIKRKLRRFENEDNTETLVISDKKDVIPVLNDLIELMKQDEKKRIFFTEERQFFFRKTVKLFSEKGLLKFIITKVDNIISAGSINFNNGYSNLLYNSGYNFDHKSLSIGLINHIENIKICIENGVKVFDFLRGGEDYKYRLGASDKKIYTIEITKKN
jgi:hypothetical protein